MPLRQPKSAPLTAWQIRVGRYQGEPIAYILGYQGFWTLDLDVTPDTLIPPPETELLVELALELLPAEAPLLIADLGTGSGAIAAALASERPAWTLMATDRSLGALGVAITNARRLRLNNLHTLAADWLAPIDSATLDAILSNPPYIPSTDPHLVRGDLRFEPAMALSAGPDGLAAIRDIADQAPSRLKPGGLVAVEHGFDQGPPVRALFAAAGLVRVEPRRERRVVGRQAGAGRPAEPAPRGRRGDVLRRRAHERATG